MKLETHLLRRVAGLSPILVLAVAKGVLAAPMARSGSWTIRRGSEVVRTCGGLAELVAVLTEAIASGEADDWTIYCDPLARDQMLTRIATISQEIEFGFADARGIDLEAA